MQNKIILLTFLVGIIFISISCNKNNSSNSGSVTPNFIGKYDLGSFVEIFKSGNTGCQEINCVDNNGYFEITDLTNNSVTVKINTTQCSPYQTTFYNIPLESQTDTTRMYFSGNSSGLIGKRVELWLSDGNRINANFNFNDKKTPCPEMISGSGLKNY